VEFQVASQPGITHAIIGILASLASAELENIRSRTKLALRKLKERGVKLGAPVCKLTDSVRKRGWTASAKLRTEQATAARNEILPMVQDLQADGLSYSQICERLNSDGWTTRRGRPWSPAHISLLLSASA
jgi:DNA invertase Pin-like site-specific DNA recombinase